MFDKATCRKRGRLDPDQSSSPTSTLPIRPPKSPKLIKSWQLDITMPPKRPLPQKRACDVCYQRKVSFMLQFSHLTISYHIPSRINSRTSLRFNAYFHIQMAHVNGVSIVTWNVPLKGSGHGRSGGTGKPYSLRSRAQALRQYKVVPIQLISI
jgi:hypothetical protein